MLSENEKLAYLAGAMDSDGFFRLKMNRNQARKNPVYTEMIGLHQVTPQICLLLKETFGGTIINKKPSSPNGRMLFSYCGSSSFAYRACVRLEPYLLIKRERAQLLIDFYQTRNLEYRSHSYWFKKENPEWAMSELISFRETMEILGYGSIYSVWNAYMNGTIVAIKGEKTNKSLPRVPMSFVEYVSSAGGMKAQPKSLAAIRNNMFLKMKEMNHLGI